MMKTLRLWRRRTKKTEDAAFELLRALPAHEIFHRRPLVLVSLSFSLSLWSVCDSRAQQRHTHTLYYERRLSIIFYTEEEDKEDEDEEEDVEKCPISQIFLCVLLKP